MSQCFVEPAYEWREGSAFGFGRTCFPAGDLVPGEAAEEGEVSLGESGSFSVFAEEFSVEGKL